MNHSVHIVRRTHIPLFTVLAGLLLSSCGVNNIPTYDETAKAKWSDVQNQYQRRADLIPNLVETVKGYAAQEREVLTQVTEARAKASQIKVDASTVTDPAKFKEYQDAQNALAGALGRLLVTVERYPDLKSNQNFLALQSQLEGTENRISVARRGYIDSVRAYNTELKTFPGIVWASTVYRGYKPMETFTVAEDVRRAPSAAGKPGDLRHTVADRDQRHPTVSAATQANTRDLAKGDVDHAAHSQPVLVGLTVSRHGRTCLRASPRAYNRCLLISRVFSVISKMAADRLKLRSRSRRGPAVFKLAERALLG